MDVTFSPDLAATNSLLINNPSGWMYLRPFGAVSSTVRPDILKELLEKYLAGRAVVDHEKCSFRVASLQKGGVRKSIRMQLNTVYRGQDERGERESQGSTIKLHR